MLARARSPHDATIRQSGSDQSTQRRPRTPCCGFRQTVGMTDYFMKRFSGKPLNI